MTCPEPNTCHFCGTYVLAGHEYNKETREWDGERHWLSDCRPDLVEHEPGELCTWARTQEITPGTPDCYAYQNRDTHEWGDTHTHFYSDGAM